MQISLYILSISVILQFIAGGVAIYMIRLTGRRTAWSFISLAVLLMGVRRLVTLINYFISDSAPLPNLDAEIIALGVSILMTSGLALIAPLFHKMRKAGIALEKSQEKLSRSQQIANLGSFDLNLNTGDFSISKETAFILDLDPDKNQILSLETFMGFIVKSEQSDFEQKLEETIKGNAPLNLIFQIKTNENKTKTIHAQGELHKDVSGNTRNIEGILHNITEQTLTEQKIIESQKELSAILRDMQDIYYRITPRGIILKISDSCKPILGYRPDELTGKNIYDYLWDKHDARAFRKELKRRNGVLYNFEGAFRHRDGDKIWVSTNARLFNVQDRTFGGVEGTIRNITEQRRAVSAMMKLSRALEQTADSVIITNQNGVIEYVNPSFETNTGYTREEALKKTPRILKSGRHGIDYYKNLWGIITSGNVFRDIIVNKKKDGSLFYEEKTITPLRDDQGNISHYISSGKDITERMLTQERIQYLAQHDILTSLPNRMFFMEQIEQSLMRAERSGKKLCIFFMDLDRFKNINDTLGHDFGDQILKKLSERMLPVLRKSDTIARIGGDEFTILLEEINEPDDAALIAQKLLETISEPLRIEKNEFFLSASIGIAVFPDDGRDSSTLIKNADTAMYRAKDNGRNTYQFYSAEMGSIAMERLGMETSLRHAIEKEDFFLEFQPQYDIHTKNIVGFEALLRWDHPEMGIVMPDTFIPVLEESGLIIPAGEWVLRNACRQYTKWKEAGIQNLIMAVNISGKQISDPNFISKLDAILEETGIETKNLELEITESTLMENIEHTYQIISAIHERNIRIAIDDFGTGYSSLSYLKQFKVHTLKIDKSFIRDITTDNDDAGIVKAVISMSKNLNLKIVAEGVETEDQLAFLRENGCDLVQGYLLSRPMKILDLSRILLKNNL